MTSITSSSERRREQDKADKYLVTNQVELKQLRELILGKDFAELQDLNRRLNDPVHRSALVADIISEAISQRVNQDDSLALSLSSTIDQSLRDAIQKDPQQPVATKINHYQYQLTPVLESLANTPHTDPLIKNMLIKHTQQNFKDYKMSIQMHIQFWQKLYKRCGITPNG